MKSLESKYRELKESFQKLPETIGSLIELTPEVREILGSLYNTESIYVKTIEIMEENKFRISCKFPKYGLSIEELDHVSNVQMQAAFNQSLYCAIGLYIRQKGPNSALSYDTFLSNRMNFIYRRDERTFSIKLKPSENSYLILQLEPILKKGNIYSITTNFMKNKECFMHGKIECLLEDKYLK